MTEDAKTSNTVCPQAAQQCGLFLFTLSFHPIFQISVLLEFTCNQNWSKERVAVTFLSLSKTTNQLPLPLPSAVCMCL